jgi:predicted  nucleic acid-binding Zn-ribbon protein
LRRRTRGEQIAALLANSSEVREVQQSLQDNQAQLDEVRGALRQAEFAAQTQRDKLEQTEKTLYAGTVGNPKELQDLQMEAESLRRHLQTLEDRQLEVLVQQEEVQERRQALSEQLASLQAKQETQHAALISERGQLQSELSTLEAEREVAAASVPAADMTRYAALSRKLGGLAVAAVAEGTCGACGLTITPSMQQSIRSGSDLINCPQCGRILYAV